MIQLSDNLWVGDSDDSYLKDAMLDGVDAVLNVAHDLQGKCSWPKVEYAQVGLIDGPGNEISGYCAAVMSLVALLRRHDVVMVYDHDGGRALVVALMYLNLTFGKYRREPVEWSHWMTWEERLATLTWIEGLPTPHTAHIEAFNRLPYGVLEALL